MALAIIGVTNLCSHTHPTFAAPPEQFSLVCQTLYPTSGRKGSGETPIVSFCLVSRFADHKINL